MIRSMDAAIAQIYAERQVTGITPRQVIPLIRLAHRGPMTIREMATMLGVSHSAASQTISALSRGGYVKSKPGSDARTRTISLTPKGRALVPLLQAEWRATEQAIAELETAIPYPMSQVVSDLEGLMAQRSFHDRILEHLDDEN